MDVDHDRDMSERVNPKFGLIDICLHGLLLTAKLFRKHCKFIDEEYFSPVAQLDQVLGTSNSSSELDPFAKLDQLYIQILLSYLTFQLSMLKNILGHVLLIPLFEGRDLYLPPIGDVLDLAPGQMELTL